MVMCYLHECLAMEVLMSSEARKSALEQRHAALEAELKSLTNKPGTDSLVAAALKREKLKVKDEIERLKA